VDETSAPEQLSDKFFSGEIVYRQEAVQDGTGNRVPLPDFHYFISGPHWKHVVAGQVTALFDPSTNVIRYFDPPSVVNASTSQGPVRFEHLDETRIILGRTCRGIRLISDQGSFLEFYDPELRVDPQPFVNHHVGYWAESLKEKSGALALWTDVAKPGFSIVSEAIRIEHRSFDPAFWNAP
jgi:hypothetical protein